MYLRYGSFTFPRDSAKVERSARAIAPAGIPLWMEWTWNVTVLLTSDNVGGSTAEAIATNYGITTEQIFAAMSYRNRRLSLYTDGGVEIMWLRAVAPGTGESGPTTEFIANPVGDGTEFAGVRTVSFVVKALYAVGDLSRVLTNFNESLTLQGTGAPPKTVRIGMRASVLQYPRAASLATAVQSGSATGAILRPDWAIPPPLWQGTDYDSDRTVFQKNSGQRQGDGITNLTVSWQYHFSRPGRPFIGAPHEFV